MAITLLLIPIAYVTVLFYVISIFSTIHKIIEKGTCNATLRYLTAFQKHFQLQTEVISLGSGNKGAISV